MNPASAFLNFYLVVVKHVSVCQNLAYKHDIRRGKRKRTGLAFKKHPRGREGMAMSILRITHADCWRAQSLLGDTTTKQIALLQERTNSS